MTENNKKQAYVPSRAEVFINHEGSAPGFALEKDGKYVICMPGPPREMTSMFEDSVMPYLQSMSEDVIYYRMLRAFGIGAVSYTHLDVYKRQSLYRLSLDR